MTDTWKIGDSSDLELGQVYWITKIDDASNVKECFLVVYEGRMDSLEEHFTMLDSDRHFLLSEYKWSGPFHPPRINQTNCIRCTKIHETSEDCCACCITYADKQIEELVKERDVYKNTLEHIAKIDRCTNPRQCAQEALDGDWRSNTE